MLSEVFFNTTKPDPTFNVYDCKLHPARPNFYQLRDQALQKAKETGATHVLVVWEIIDFMRVDLEHPHFVFCYRAEDLNALIRENNRVGETKVGEVISL